MDKELGISTDKIRKSNDKDNFHYQGAGYLVLLTVFKQLPDHLKNKGFVDYGSGKGRALFFAEYCGFNRLIGVELNDELTQTARQNALSYSKKRKESSFEFYTENALNFIIPSDCATFYFFNPFSDKIMREVTETIKRYSQLYNQEVFVVYLNPTYSRLWIDSGFKVYKTITTGRYTEACIYTYSNQNR